MKIERVDDKTIKCYLSKDELAYYQVDYSDFISRTENAQRLLREIIETAKSEVGYHPPKIAFEMQIMMVPEQGMVLTFSEKDPAMGVLSLPAPVQNTPAAKAGGKEQSAPAIDVNDAIFMFTYLSDFMDYAQGLPRGIRIDSTLYKMGEEFYLHIARGKASYDRFSRSCVQALEFSQLFSAGPGCDEVLKEHGEVIIATKAVNRFRK